MSGFGSAKAKAGAKGVKDSDDDGEKEMIPFCLASRDLSYYYQARQRLRHAHLFNIVFGL